MKPKAFSYVRFSTPEQAKGDSRRRQIELSRHYCDEHGLVLDDTLTDEGISAYKGKNAAVGALGGFLAAVAKGKVPKGSFLLVESLDRLSRQDIEKALAQFLSIIQAGIIIVTLSDGNVYKTGASNMLSQLIISITIMSRAHEESRTKSNRVAASWHARRATASQKRLTAMAPKWLEKDGDRFREIKSRGDLVRRMFELKKAGYGKLAIQSTFNREGIPTWKGGARRASFWHYSYIGRILNSRAVLGEFQPHIFVDGKRQPHGKPILNYFPSVVSEDLFNEVQCSHPKGGGRPSNKERNLFSHVAKCGHCGSSMHFTNKRGYEYLVCARAIGGGKCSYLSWSYPKFQATFLAWIVEIRWADVFGLKQSSKLPALRSELSSLTGKIGEIEKRVSRLLDVLEAGAESSAAVAQRLHNHGQEKKIAEARVLVLTDEIAQDEALAEAASENGVEITQLVEKIGGVRRNEQFVAEYDAKELKKAKAISNIPARKMLKNEILKRISRIEMYPDRIPVKSELRAKLRGQIEFLNDLGKGGFASSDGESSSGPVPIVPTVLDCPAFVVRFKNGLERYIIPNPTHPSGVPLFDSPIADVDASPAFEEI